MVASNSESSLACVMNRLDRLAWRVENDKPIPTIAARKNTTMTLSRDEYDPLVP